MTILGAKMLKANKIIIISLSSVYLAACSIDGTTNSMANWGGYNYSDSQTVYPDSYDAYQVQQYYHGDSNINNNYQNNRSYQGAQSVVVPDSYHVSSGKPPASKDLDKNWINNQNPSSYTIELANDNKPSKVAGVLYKAPKNERSAEVKTNNGNYKGVYGSYPSYEAAQEKLNSLPENIKNNAKITNWNNVQKDIN